MTVRDDATESDLEAEDAARLQRRRLKQSEHGFAYYEKGDERGFRKRFVTSVKVDDLRGLDRADYRREYGRRYRAWVREQKAAALEGGVSNVSGQKEIVTGESSGFRWTDVLDGYRRNER